MVVSFAGGGCFGTDTDIWTDFGAPCWNTVTVDCTSVLCVQHIRQRSLEILEILILIQNMKINMKNINEREINAEK